MNFDLEIVISVVFGIAVGISLAGPFLVRCYFRIKKDASLIKEPHGVILACSEVQGDTIKFFQETEKKLNYLVRRSIQKLRMIDQSNEAQFIMEPHGELVGKRNIDGLHLNSKLLDVAEKVANFDKELRKRKRIEGSEAAPEHDHDQSTERPVLSVVVNNTQDLDNTQSDKLN